MPYLKKCEQLSKLSNIVFYAANSKRSAKSNCKYFTGGQDRGIDIWNPLEGTIKTIVAEMPMEIGQTKPYQRAKIVSTNKNTELIFFGGMSDNLITEVWKYKYVSGQWELLGNIQIGRIGHLAIPVMGMKCP